MPVPIGTIFRIKTYKSGKRVRLAIHRGEVIETTPLRSPKSTKTRKRLVRRKRKIGLR